MITDDGFLQTHIAIFFAFKLLSLKSFDAQYSTKVSELGLLSQISQFYHSPQAPSGDGCTGFLSHTEIDCPQLSEHRPTPRLAGAVHSRSLRLWRLKESVKTEKTGYVRRIVKPEVKKRVVCF